MTGESVDLILGEAETMLCDDGGDGKNGAMPPMSLLEKISTDATDKVHEKYVEAVDAWKSCRSLLPLLDSDPFRGCSGTPEGHNQFSKKQRLVIARCFRIQVNAISIDSLCRANHMLAASGSQMLLGLHSETKIFSNDQGDDDEHYEVSSWIADIRQNTRVIFVVATGVVILVISSSLAL